MKSKFKSLKIENYCKSIIEDDDRKIENEYGCKIETILKQVFKHESFRHLQKNIILKFISKRDVFVLMPTGTINEMSRKKLTCFLGNGKSLNYQLPSLVFSGITFVICPLIALMQNQINSLKSLGIPCAFINSNLKTNERVAVIQEILKPEPVIKIVYVTPELIQTQFFSVLKRVNENKNLSSFVVDEAHAVSTWGHDFRPAYVKLSLLKTSFPQVPIMACTATATEKVRQDIIKTLGLVDVCSFFSSFNRPNIIYSIKYKNCIEDLLLDIKSTIDDFLFNGKTCGIIYCHKRSECDDLSASLNNFGLSTAAYHAGLKDNDRNAILNNWMNQKIQVIIATIAFGMGIDNPNVRFVIHYNIPKSLEDYYQESGRAGRDGKTSNAILYYSKADVNMMKFVLSSSGKNEDKDKKAELKLEKLSKVTEYCESASCRRAKLLNYFGETVESSTVCNKTCDYCCNPDVVRKAVNGQDLKKTVRSNQPFGMKSSIPGDSEKQVKCKRFKPFKNPSFREENSSDDDSLADMWKRPYGNRRFKSLKNINTIDMSESFQPASKLTK